MKRACFISTVLALLLLVFTSLYGFASPGWVSPTGFVDSGSVWSSETLAYDEDTGSYAYADALKGGWTDYFELTHDALNCDRVQLWVQQGIANVNSIEVGIYYSSSWNNIHSGAPVSWGAWNTYLIGSTQSVTAMRIRFYSTKAGTGVCQVMEADFEEVPSCSPDISNLPISNNYGLVEESGTYETGLTNYSVTNNSSGSITITIQAADFTGGNGWSLSDTATPGVDTVGLKAGIEGGDYTIIVKKTPAYNVLVSGLADSATQNWGLKLYAPTSFSDGIEKTSVVTLTAMCD